VIKFVLLKLKEFAQNNALGFAGLKVILIFIFFKFAYLVSKCSNDFYLFSIILSGCTTEL
jgi:hypothetical protein